MWFLWKSATDCQQDYFIHKNNPHVLFPVLGFYLLNNVHATVVIFFSVLNQHLEINTF